MIDRNDLAKLKIECPGFDTCTADLQNIGEDIDYEGRVRAGYKAVIAKVTSRYIDSIEKEYQKNHLNAQMVFDILDWAAAFASALYYF